MTTLLFPNDRVRAYHDRALPYCCDFDCDKDCDPATCDLLQEEERELGLCKWLGLAAEERKKATRVAEAGAGA